MNIYDFLLNSKSLELKNDTLHKRQMRMYRF